jgi:hypothetical protein
MTVRAVMIDFGCPKYNFKHSRSIAIYKAKVNFLIKLPILYFVSNTYFHDLKLQID